MNDAGPRRVRPPAGGLLVAVGAAVFVAAWSLAPASGWQAGGNRPINASAGDRLDVTGHNSPSLVVDPTDGRALVAASRVNTPAFSCGLHRSSDGGVSWEQLDVPQLPFETTVECFAPDVAFSADGRLHLAFTSFGRVEGEGTVPEAVWLASTGGSGELSAPRRVGGPLAFHLRLAADPADPARLYLVWVASTGASGFGFTDTESPVVVSRSEDGGETWSEPVEVSTADRPRVAAPDMAIDADGRLYVSYLDVGEDRLDYHGAHEGVGGPPYRGGWQLVVARSSDGGRSWQETVADDELVPVERFVMLHPPAPSIAGQAGHVHVAFHDGRAGDADVWLWTSTDGAASFGAPVRVNDTALGDGTTQRLPAVAVAPDGRVDVVYYDRRADPRGDVMTEVSWQSSSNAAATFGARLRLSDRSFDSRIGRGAERDLPDMGDRLALVSTTDGALALWADTRGVDAASRKQNLARSVVHSVPPSRSWSLLQVAAGITVTVGAGLLAYGAVRRGRDDDG